VTVHNWAYAGLTLTGLGLIFIEAAKHLDWTWLFGEDWPGADTADNSEILAEVRDHKASAVDLVDDLLNPAIRMDQATVDAEFAAIAADVAHKLGTDFTGPNVDFQAWEQDMPNTPSIQRLLLELENPPLRYRVVWDGDTPNYVDLTSTGRNHPWVVA
jgi:hypothetical protein